LDLFRRLPNGQIAKAKRELARKDLFFLLVYILGRGDVDRDWLFERCTEVQRQPDDCLDLWAREHYKSTIITFGKTIQDILTSHGTDPDPKWQGRELTIGIFSHTRPIAKGFLKQIKREFEANRELQRLFPDVVWDNTKDSPQWSEDGGIVLKRKSNPKESTVEAWGVVDGQPIGKHFHVLVYDDIVTRESVTTPEMIEKTTDCLALSYNLGIENGIRRFIGTRYHFADTYREIINRGTAKPRIYQATVDGDVNGLPVLMSSDTLATKRRDMGPYVFSCQMMQNPIADETQGFRPEWLRYYDGSAAHGTTKYFLIDAASEKRKTNDYTAFWCIGLGSDQNYYVLDLVRDRLNLTQRAALVITKHREWQPIDVRYERYGLMADIEHIKSQQEREVYRFEITEVGGQTSKTDRIKRLVPLFEQGRIYFPRTLHYTDHTGCTRNLIHDFVEEEYKAFPVPVHDDMLDALARIAEPDLELKWPRVKPKVVNMHRSAGWMG
jgi:predicted phage terminase large subunit-like protein